MTAIPQPRPDIHLVMPEAQPSVTVLAWLRSALPGGFVQLAPVETEGDPAAGLRVFLLPDLVGFVAEGLEAGGELPDLLAHWGGLAHRAETAGAAGFALHLGDLMQDPPAMAQALAQWCPDAAGAGYGELPELSGEAPAADPLVQALIAAFLAADPAATLPQTKVSGPAHAAPDAQALAAAAARLGADRAALTREAAARREAAGWLEALRRTLWSEADRAAQAEARMRDMESRLAEASRAAAVAASAAVSVPDPALAERVIHLEETLAARDAYIHKLHHSKSWAVTAPLRNLSRILRRA